VQATGKLYHLRLRVEYTVFCNLQSQARTHAVMMIGLYEFYLIINIIILSKLFAKWIWILIGRIISIYVYKMWGQVKKKTFKIWVTILAFVTSNVFLIRYTCIWGYHYSSV